MHLNSAVAKATKRLLPLLGFGYLFNYIDRTNVGIASLQMNDALALTATQFGLAAGLFYIGNCLLEVCRRTASSLEQTGGRTPSSTTGNSIAPS